MPREKNKKTHNIFLLDPERIHRVLDLDSSVPVSQIIEGIMSLDEEYKAQTIQETIATNGFSISLYFKKDEPMGNKFASFCSAFVAEDQDAVTFRPRSSSSVLFIWREKKIYAVTTGQGFRMIENYAVPNFGLIIASVFEQNFKITSLDSNAMSSIIHSAKTVYSNEIDFIDIEALDTVFKEVTGRLKDVESVHSLLNLSRESRKDSMKITAKNYVQFSNSLNFAGLLHLLDIISNYNIENISDRFNLITPMTLKKNGDIISNNKDAVVRAMYEAIISEKQFPFDLFHRDTNKYIAADSYTIYNPIDQSVYSTQEDYEASTIISSAFDTYLSGDEKTLDKFTSFVNLVRLRSEREDHVETDGTLFQHLSGEIRANDINYYLFYGEYYRLSTAYDDRLKESLRGKLRPEFITSEILTPWPKGKDEDYFNKQVSLSENYVHLHKIKPDYIEFGDLLKNDSDVVTVVHVKDGFDGAMRILDRQVELSITKIMDLKHNNNDFYMKKLYRNASQSTTGKNITSVFASSRDFIDAMKNKKVRFVIVIRPKNPDLLEAESNIAKHCLNALILRCFNQGISLSIQVV